MTRPKTQSPHQSMAKPNAGSDAGSDTGSNAGSDVPDHAKTTARSGDPTLGTNHQAPVGERGHGFGALTRSLSSALPDTLTAAQGDATPQTEPTRTGATGAYTLTLPETRTTSVVFASPHSGRDYSAAFLAASILDDHLIRSSEDAFVDRLFAAAPDFGAPLLAARVPRAYIDLNRSADELDPAVIDGVRRASPNPRIASGLGVIPRVVSNGRAIYAGKLTLAEAEKRIAQGWHPYHRALSEQLNIAHDCFGRAILIDCHSMPHEAVECLSKTGQKRPDVVIGDRFGASADAAIVDRIEAAFSAAGLRVARNTPFAGAYVTQHYGRPLRNQHAVQIEIDRSLYMDERRITPRPDFKAFRDIMTAIIAQITAIGQPDEQPLAAE